MILGIVIHSDHPETVWNACRLANFAIIEGDKVKVSIASGANFSDGDSEKKFIITAFSNDNKTLTLVRTGTDSDDSAFVTQQFSVSYGSYLELDVVAGGSWIFVLEAESSGQGQAELLLELNNTLNCDGSLIE